MTETTEIPESKKTEAAVAKLVSQLNDTISEKMEKRDTDLAEKIDKQIREGIERMKRQHAEENPSFSLPGCEDHEFSFAKACWAIRTGDWRQAGFEKECMKNMQERYGEQWTTQVYKDAATAPNTGYISSPDGLAGPHLVPEEHMNEIIGLFYAESVAFQLGARAMPGAFGTIAIPVLLSGAAATWAYENAESAETDPTFGQHTMRPRRLTGSVRMSNMLLQNSRPMAEQVVRANMTEQFRVALDTAILKGSGSGANPTGLLNATPQMSGELSSGAVNLTASGNPWTYALAMEFIVDLANANALRGSLGWAMNPTDWSEAMQMPGTTNLDVARIVTQDGAATRLLGYPIRTTTILARTAAASSTSEETIIFGDWSQIRVPFWRTLELRATDVGAGTFLRDQTLIRGTLSADISIDHLESFSVGSTSGL